MPGSGTGTFSNNYGFYSLTLTSSDTISLEISYVGYKSLARQIAPHSDLTLSFDLEHNDQQEQINKLTITNDKREDNIRKNQSSLVDMSTDMIAAAPSTTGTGDVISSVELLPGVQAGIDGTPGYFVRGGNAGQNLILLD